MLRRITWEGGKVNIQHKNSSVLDTLNLKILESSTWSAQVGHYIYTVKLRSGDWAANINFKVSSILYRLLDINEITYRGEREKKRVTKTPIRVPVELQH